MLVHSEWFDELNKAYEKKYEYFLHVLLTADIQFNFFFRVVSNNNSNHNYSNNIEKEQPSQKRQPTKRNGIFI